jgi:anti-sigma factor RsiW
MSNDPLYEKLRETAWRRKLNAEEDARLSEWLAAHPETHADWDSEAELNELLATLPDVPVASNFTARVLATARRESSNDKQMMGRTGLRADWWTKWLPKTALAAVFLAAGLISYNHLQSVRRAEWAQSLSTVSQLGSLPSPDVLNDFDTIAALSAAHPADEELLKIMQ